MVAYLRCIQIFFFLILNYEKEEKFKILNDDTRKEKKAAVVY